MAADSAYPADQKPLSGFEGSVVLYTIEITMWFSSTANITIVLTSWSALDCLKLTSTMPFAQQLARPWRNIATRWCLVVNQLF